MVTCLSRHERGTEMVACLSSEEASKELRWLTAGYLLVGYERGTEIGCLLVLERLERESNQRDDRGQSA